MLFPDSHKHHSNAILPVILWMLHEFSKKFFIHSYVMTFYTMKYYSVSLFVLKQIEVSVRK